MRFLFKLSMLLMVSVLVACGGGGGSGGESQLCSSGTVTTGCSSSTTNTTTTAPLFTTAPPNITLPSSSSSLYQIQGGVPAYSATSMNESVAKASLDTSTGMQLTIKAVAPGNTNVVIKDSVGITVTINVTVPQPATLYTIPSSAISTSINATQIITVGGGVPFSIAQNQQYPYIVNNETPSVVSVTPGFYSNNTPILSIVGLASGTSNVSVVDSVGNIASFIVTVPAPPVLYSDAPANLTLTNGTQNVFTIYGGTKLTGAAYYKLNNSNTNAVTASISGSTLSISAIAPGTATLIVSDAASSSITITVTVPAVGALVSTAPTALTLTSGTSSPTYLISGGAPYASGKKYGANSGTPSLVGVSLDTTGTQLTISALANTQGGTANVLVTDSAGTTLTIAVTVPAPIALFTTAPASIAIPPNASTPVLYSIFGGSAPYSAVSANTTIATVASPGAGNGLQISGVAPGSTTVTVYDKLGASVTINVTVVVSAPLFTSAPGTGVTIDLNGSATYSVNGGVPAYMVTSSNQSVATVSQPTATSFTISPASVGTANITITDTANASITIPVTISSQTALSTNAPATLNLPLGSGAFSAPIKGGYPAYSVTDSSNGTLVSTSVIGTATTGYTLNITPLGSTTGTAYVYLTDSLHSSTVTITVNVGAVTALYTSAPATLNLALTGGGGPQTYLVGGGTPFSGGSSLYQVATDSGSAYVTATMAGSVLTITPLAVGQAVVKISDSLANTISITVNVSSTGGGGGGTSSTPQYPTMSSIMQTAAPASAPTSTIAATGYNQLVVTLKDPSGTGIANQVISATATASQIGFPQGATALTNALGVATFQVSRASLTATGAGAITISYNYLPGAVTYPTGYTAPTTGTTINSYVGYQLGTANVALSIPLAPASSPGLAASMPAYGTTQVPVNVTINNVAATTPVAVSFTSSCGQVLPATASTNSAGAVLVTFSATDAAGTTPSTLGCGGKTVQITASTAGATTVSQSINVAAAPATAISFSGASPQRIYLQNSGGVTQSQLTFQLLNQQGAGVPGQSVQLTLLSLNGGTPKAAFDTSGNTAPVTLVTDSNGNVSQPVYSGSVPTSVIVQAALVSNPTITINSSILVIASGRPVQSSLSLAVDKWAIEGWDVDGNTANVTLSMADRNGNPVPDGTAVNFVAQSGVMIPPVCQTKNSQCNVTIRSQGTRPILIAPGASGVPSSYTALTRRNAGLVTILAYASGDEDFVDENGTNYYECNDPFTDLGLAYLDTYMYQNGIVNTFTTPDFSVPRSAGASACAATAQAPTAGQPTLVTPSNILNPSTATVTIPAGDFGDGVWGAADVRQQALIVFATRGAFIVAPNDGPGVVSDPVVSTDISGNFTGITFKVEDENYNSMPSGSTIAVTLSLGLNMTTSGSTCVVASNDNVPVPNSINPLTVTAGFGGCVKAGAGGNAVTITVTSPTSNTVTAKSIAF